jgi:magnesium chelatase family protein
MIGGGSTSTRPGAVSLAHHGVLFLADAPEFPAAVLDTLRGPLEHGEVTIVRSGGTTRYAARFQLVMTANPCACAARAGEPDCRCTPSAKRRYRGRISGPLLDRVDLQVTLEPPRPHQATSGELPGPGEGSERVAVRVAAARAAAGTRLRGSGWRVNADIPGAQLRTRWRLPAAVTAAADNQLDRGALSTRGYFRILRVAWTISDLAGREYPTGADIAEALTLRAVDAPPRTS